ncbi:unnamed protein product, partial [Brassica oleracea var. botrytis]
GEDHQFHLLHHSFARCLIHFGRNPKQRGDMYEVFRRSYIGVRTHVVKAIVKPNALSITTSHAEESVRIMITTTDLTNDHDDHCHCYGRY